MPVFHRLRRVALVASLVLPLLLLAGACGPIEYINQVSRKASSEVEAARAVKADKHAPYWYTLAVEYLHKAREEAAASDFQSANRYGRQSTEAARKARTLAIERARNPQAQPQPVTSGSDEDGNEIVDPTSEEATEDAEDNPLGGPSTGKEGEDN